MSKKTKLKAVTKKIAINIGTQEAQEWVEVEYKEYLRETLDDIEGEKYKAYDEKLKAREAKKGSVEK